MLTTLSSIMELVGTAVAAGIIAVIGVSGAIYIDMVTFLLSAAIILFVKSREERQQKQSFHAKEYLETFTDGLKYVKTDKVICFFMGITLFMNAVLVPFNSLQAPLVSEIFSGGAEVLSIMSISATVSMLLGSVIYPKLDGKMSGKTLFLICGVGMGVYYASVILCQPLYVNKIFMYAFAALATGILGFCAAMCCSFLNVEFVRRVDEKYLARTDAISMSLAMAALPVVSFVISALVAYVSTATFFVAAGVVDIIVCIFIVRSHVLDDEKEVETVKEQESIAM